ncbi:MAG TPA: class I SAM-dependent methyltransferase [Chthoniobacterales bacterium]
MSASPEFHVEIDHVRRHYDRLSWLYQFFWGEHLHHGYWDNNQSAAQAQVRLMERLAETAGVPRGAEVLDIGCGLGGSAFWLAGRFDCRVTGLTISPVQARMAAKKAKARRLSDRVRFQVADANEWQPRPASVDMVWIMESSEHFRDKRGFFQRCAAALRPGGVLAVAAWLRRDGPVREDERALVATIGAAMLSASLDGLSDYRRWMEEAGLVVTAAEDITRHIAPTWTHCARMVEGPPVKWLLRFTSRSTQSFVKSFPLMRQAYAQGAMAFGIFAARKPR